MPAFAQTVIGQLQSFITSPVDTHILVAAADLISKHKIENFHSGVFPEIDREGVTQSEVKAIREYLILLLSVSNDPSILGTILCALSKLRDPGLTGLVQHHIIRARQMHVSSEHYLRSGLFAAEDSGEAMADSEDIMIKSTSYLKSKDLIR